MKYYEKWEDEITRLAEKNITIAVRDGKPILCQDTNCKDCELKRNTRVNCINALLIWLYKEYEEPKVDWSKVEIDTPILVSVDGKDWEKRYFAKYEDDYVYTFIDGLTSWTGGDYALAIWTHVKLAEVE